MTGLMRRLIDFETTPDGGEVPGGGAPPEPTPAVEPPAWSGPSQEEWQQTQSALQQLGGVAPFMAELQQLLGDEGEQQPQQQPDGIDPQMAQYLDQLVDQRYQERFGAFEPVLGQIAEREGEQIARSQLDRLAGEGGEFNRDLALIAAQQFVSQGHAPDAALQQAAQYAREMQKGIEETAIKQYQESLANAANLPVEPGATGAAVTQPNVATGRDRYEQTLERFNDTLRPVIGGTQ